MRVIQKLFHLYTPPKTTTIPYILIITLMSINLACLQTAMTAQSEPTSAPSAASTPLLPESAPRTEIENGEVFEIPTPNHTCATVTAEKALHLREKPDEKSTVIYWLQAGEQVKVIGKVGEWWKIQADGYSGYAKANYLQETECE